MKAVGKRIIIRIDKAAQTERREFMTSVDKDTGAVMRLHRPPNQINYAFNLQYGEVLSIGAPVPFIFPEVEIGDILIFHHFVEHKPSVEGDINYYNPFLLGVEENGDEILFVRCSNDQDCQVFGVLKSQSGVIIPFKDTVFCHGQYTDAQFYQSEAGLDLFTSFQEDIPKKLEEIKNQIDEIRGSSIYKKLHKYASMDTSGLPMKTRLDHEQGVYKLGQKVRELEDFKVAPLIKERQRLSAALRASRFYEYTLLFIHPDTAGGLDLQMGDKVIALKEDGYPLNIFGLDYSLVDANEIAMVKFKDTEDYVPLNDWVLIKGDEAEEKTAGGLFIPEMSIIKANTGTVISVGPSCTVTEGYRVRFTRTSHVPITIGGTEYLLMREARLVNSFGVA